MVIELTLFLIWLIGIIPASWVTYNFMYNSYNDVFKWPAGIMALLWPFSLIIFLILILPIWPLLLRK